MRRWWLGLALAAGCAPVDPVDLELAASTETVLIAIVPSSFAAAESIFYVAAADRLPYGLEVPDDFSVWIFEYSSSPEALGLATGEISFSLGCETACCRSLPEPVAAREGFDAAPLALLPQWYDELRFGFSDPLECLADGRGVLLSRDGARCCGEVPCDAPYLDIPLPPVPPALPCFDDECGPIRFTADCGERSLLGGGCNDALVTCPPDGWPANAPPDAVFVDPSAPRSGTGTRQAPFRTIAEALAAESSATIALRAGTHDGPGRLNRSVKFLGACAEQTVVASSTAAPFAFVGGWPVELRDLTLRADASTAALVVSSGATARLDDVILVDGRLLVGDCGRVVADGLVARDMTVWRGGKLDVRQAFADGPLTCGGSLLDLPPELVGDRPGWRDECQADLGTEVRVARSVFESTITSQAGCSASVLESLVVESSSVSLWAYGGALTVVDTVARRPDKSCPGAPMVNATDSATVVLERIALMDGGRSIRSSGSTLVAHDVWIRGDCERYAGVSFIGTWAQLGRASMVGSGVYADGGRVDLYDLEIERAETGLTVAPFQSGPTDSFFDAIRVAIESVETGVLVIESDVVLTQFVVADANVGLSVSEGVVRARDGVIADVDTAVVLRVGGGIDAVSLALRDGQTAFHRPSLERTFGLNVLEFEATNFNQFYLGSTRSDAAFQSGSIVARELGVDVSACRAPDVRLGDVVWKRWP